jgi:hypothetical protein
MYKLQKNSISNSFVSTNRMSDGACIPFAPDNTDYQTFKKDLAEGASLKDAEGNDMTAEQITTFLGELK